MHLIIYSKQHISHPSLFWKLLVKNLVLMIILENYIDDWLNGLLLNSYAEVQFHVEETLSKNPDDASDSPIFLSPRSSNWYIYLA